MKLLWFVGMTISLIMCIIAYMFADNQHPYTYDIKKSYVKPNPAESGRQVLVHWEFKVNRVCPGAIVRTIVDVKTGARISYDPTPAVGTVKIGDTYLERTFFLPEEMSPGPKLYRSNGEYICNPLQRIFPLKVQTPDIPFEVK